MEVDRTSSDCAMTNAFSGDWLFSYGKRLSLPRLLSCVELRAAADSGSSLSSPSLKSSPNLPRLTATTLYAAVCLRLAVATFPAALPTKQWDGLIRKATSVLEPSR